jgi:flagellar hook-associated protein 2
MASITASGLGSGLDINGLVSQLVAAESKPASTRLDRREVSLQSQLSAIGTFKGALSDLQSAISALTSTSKFEGMKTTVGDESLFTASTTNTAQVGTYRVEVKKLAQAQTLVSSENHRFAAATDTVGTGTLILRFGSYDANGVFTENAAHTQPSPITIDESNNTLSGIRDAINEANIGVRANIVNDGSGYRLVLSSSETGEKNALQISVADDDGNNTDAAGLSLLAFGAGANNMTQTTAAQDAQLVVDGLSVNSTGNTVTGVLDGVTFNLKAAKEGTTTTLAVAKDTGAATNAVQSLVDAYNKFTDTVNSLTAYNTATKEGGPLLGDASVRSISGQVRSALGAQVGDTTSTLHTLSDIGISFQKDGKLSLDKSKLEKALAADPQAVANLFAGTEGIAVKLDKQLDSLLKSGGPLGNRTDVINKQIERLGDQREILNQRMESLEKRYRAQFTALDKLVSQLTATGNYLTQQLANLPGAKQT